MFSTDTRFLVVDDSPTGRDMVKELLSRLGYSNITEAVDGLDAVESLEKSSNEGKSFNIVIADWNMPRMNGLDLLVYMKQNPKYNTIPFLMFTAESDVSLVTLALSSGADEFIVKPVTEENLLEKLKSIWTKINENP